MPSITTFLNFIVLHFTGNDNSCTAAAEVLKAKNVKLYALVNNAGLFLNTNPEIMSKFPKILMNTNYMGPKRVTEAMIDLIDPLEGTNNFVSSYGRHGILIFFLFTVCSV